MENETLVIESPDSIKSIEVKDGKAHVGAYALRFSGPEQKDLQGEYFTPKTYLGSRKGDGVDVLFNHGQAPTKAFEEICDRVFTAAKSTVDAVGVFVEHVLDLADQYEAAIATLCSQGKLKWSSGATSHMVKRAKSGEIIRWPIAEFSYTPTPAEPRLPAIAPLKSVTVDEEMVTEISEAWKANVLNFGNNLPPKVEKVDKETSSMTDAEKSAFEEKVRTELKNANEIEMAELRKNLEESTKAQVEARIKDISEILVIGDKFSATKEAREYVVGGKSLAEFKDFVLEKFAKSIAVETAASADSTSAKGLLDQMEAIKDPAERTEFYKKHEAEIKAANRELKSK